MKLREKKTGTICSSYSFNTHGLGEIIVGYGENGMDSSFITDFDVWLEKTNQWKDMHQAFKDKDLIPDNYDKYFYEPENEEEKVRGYRL